MSAPAEKTVARDPHWGRLQRSFRLPNWFKGEAPEKGERKWEEKEEGRKREERKKGKGEKDERGNAGLCRLNISCKHSSILLNLQNTDKLTNLLTSFDAQMLKSFKLSASGGLSPSDHPTSLISVTKTFSKAVNDVMN